jgi:predicted Zn-dependent peptidase
MHDYHAQVSKTRTSVHLEIHDDFLKSIVDLFNKFVEQIRLTVETVMKEKAILINQRQEIEND